MSLGPLSGLRVVELARVLAGPWCGQLLSDLGAEVIKIERPGSGDDTRHWGPPFVVGPNGNNLGAAYFHAANRGKRSISVDITTPQGQRRVLELIAGADVVIENYKVGGLVKYGLDAASLIARQPNLVVCSITGFGQTGPYAHRAGYDFVIQGLSGFMSVNGEPGGPPLKAGVPYADLLTGIYSAVAVLAALRHRDQSGAGAHIDMALLDTQVAVLSNQALSWMASGVVPKRMGNGHTNLVPYQAFKTLDGELIIAIGNDAQFRRLGEVLGLNPVVVKRFATNAERVRGQLDLIALLEDATMRWRASDLSRALEKVDVPAGQINDIQSAFADPQVKARKLAIDRNGVPGVASPIVIDGVRLVSDGPSPDFPDPVAAASIGWRAKG